jgi:hypothetical protein
MLLPMEFYIIFDGWSKGNYHYVALFVFPTLAIQPIPDYDASNETDFQVKAPTNKECIVSLLESRQRSPDALGFLVGDNFSSNMALAAPCGVPLIGCESHHSSKKLANYVVPPILSQLKETSLVSCLATIRCNTSLNWKSIGIHQILD